jgi:hypothetical protein
LPPLPPPPLPPLLPLPPVNSYHAGYMMAVAAEAMCRSGERGFPRCMVSAILVCVGAIGSLLAANCATASANSSTTGSPPWYSGGLLIALALLQLSSLLPRYKGSGSLGSTGEICGGST